MIHQQFGKLFFEKYHPVVGGLSVAFETTFAIADYLHYSFEDLSSSGVTEADFKALIHRRGEETVQRVYNPAYRAKDLFRDGFGFLVFIPFADETNALFHRVCFRYKNTDPNQNIALARFGEEKAFTFPVVRNGDCAYITLNFLGKGAEKFEDLYVKIEKNGNIFYYKISASLVEEGVVVMTDRVDKKSAPDHLQTAK
jgi:hypothetical protein